MKIRSKKPKGQRIFNNTHKKRPYWIEPINTDYWFNLSTGEWELSNEYTEGGRTSSYYAMEYYGYLDVWSLKAAKRLIAKWNVLKGTTFRVGLPWIGYDFYITK